MSQFVKKAREDSSQLVLSLGFYIFFLEILNWTFALCNSEMDRVVKLRKREGPDMEEAELRRDWGSQFNDWKHYEKGS